MKIKMGMKIKKNKDISFGSTAFVKANLVILLLYVLSTSFFIYQHTTGISWDFSVYVLNAKYWFGNGSYFEWPRPPLASFLIGIFSLFGWKFAEYSYIILVSSLFGLSSTMLAKKLDINPPLFYALSLSPFTLNFGLSVGTELLSLSLLELFLVFFDDRIKSPLFMALGVLARYTSGMYCLLVFLKKHIKEILSFFMLLFLFILSWLFFNWYDTGNPFKSMIDQYALSVKFRSYMRQPFNIYHISMVLNYYIIFMVFGFLKRVKQIDKIDWLMILIFFLTIVSYWKIPFKDPRYLFMTILPASYFSSVFIKNLKFEPKFEYYLVFFIIAVNFSSGCITFVSLDDSTIYETVASKLKLDDCMVMSNAWPYLNYFGVVSDSNPWEGMVDYQIQMGKRIVLFKSLGEPEYVKNETYLSQFPVIENTSEYVILGRKDLCAEKAPVKKSYLETLKENKNVTVTDCEIFLSKKICDRVNQRWLLIKKGLSTKTTRFQKMIRSQKNNTSER